MGRLVLAFSVLVWATAARAESARPNPARAIFENDWVLMNWALKFYDSDRDVLLEPEEAQAAADAFRRIADGDGDGRVTPLEYRQARAFILARY